MYKIRGLIKIPNSFIQVSQLFVVTTRHRILINVKSWNFMKVLDPELFSAGFWFVRFDQNSKYVNVDICKTFKKGPYFQEWVK